VRNTCRSVDQIGVPVTFNYNRSATFTTTCGGIFSLFSILVISQYIACEMYNFAYSPSYSSSYYTSYLRPPHNFDPYALGKTDLTFAVSLNDSNENATSVNLSQYVVPMYYVSRKAKG